MSEKILVVDDEISLQETLAYNLKKQGYEVETTGIMLPGLDGFEICRILRKEMSTPVLMLTARDDEIDRVVGLEVGADDYLAKPFSMRELIARVKALLRRVRLIHDEINQNADDDQKLKSEILTFDNLIIDMSRRETIRLCLLSPKNIICSPSLHNTRGRCFLVS